MTNKEQIAKLMEEHKKNLQKNKQLRDEDEDEDKDEYKDEDEDDYEDEDEENFIYATRIFSISDTQKIKDHFGFTEDVYYSPDSRFCISLSNDICTFYVKGLNNYKWVYNMVSQIYILFNTKQKTIEFENLKTKTIYVITALGDNYIAIQAFK